MKRIFVFLLLILVFSGCFKNFLYEYSGVVLVNNSEYKLKIFCYGPYGLEAIANLAPGESVLSYNLSGFTEQKRVFVANAYVYSSNSNLQLKLIGIATKEESFNSYSARADIRKVVFYNSDFSFRRR
jgi:hypothetical protein